MSTPLFVSEIERRERENAFLEKAKKRFGDRFDYSKVHYTNNMTKIIIICKKHGEFLQAPVKHLQHKHACPQCAKIGYAEAKRVKKSELIAKGKELFGDIYDYTETKIGKRNDFIEVYCKKHNEYFSQRLELHLRGRTGCKKCQVERKKQNGLKKFKRNFIEKFVAKFGNEYDFSKVEYVNNRTPITVICKKHNIEFKQVHRNIARFPSCACPECKNEYQKKKKEK